MAETMVQQQNNGQKKQDTDPMKALDLQYGYYEEPEDEQEQEDSDWLKGLIEYVKARKMAQTKQVAE